MHDLNPPSELTILDHVYDHRRTILLIALAAGLLLSVLAYVWLLVQAGASVEQGLLGPSPSGIKIALQYPPWIEIGSTSYITVSIDPGGAVVEDVPLIITLSEKQADEVLIAGPRQLTTTLRSANTLAMSKQTYELHFLQDSGKTGVVELVITARTPHWWANRPFEVKIRSNWMGLLLRTSIILTALGLLIVFFWTNLTGFASSHLTSRQPNQ